MYLSLYHCSKKKQNNRGLFFYSINMQFTYLFFFTKIGFKKQRITMFFLFRIMMFISIYMFSLTWYEVQINKYIFISISLPCSFSLSLNHVLRFSLITIFLRRFVVQSKDWGEGEGCYQGNHIQVELHTRKHCKTNSKNNK